MGVMIGLTCGAPRDENTVWSAAEMSCYFQLPGPYVEPIAQQVKIDDRRRAVIYVSVVLLLAGFSASVYISCISFSRFSLEAYPEQIYDGAYIIFKLIFTRNNATYAWSRICEDVAKSSLQVLFQLGPYYWWAFWRTLTGEGGRFGPPWDLEKRKADFDGVNAIRFPSSWTTRSVFENPKIWKFGVQGAKNKIRRFFTKCLKLS